MRFKPVSYHWRGLRESLETFAKTHDAADIARAILASGFVFKFAFVLWQFSDRHFLVPPGGDPIVHMDTIKQILSGHLTTLAYPPLYHYLIAAVSTVFKADPIAVMKFFSVILLFLPIPFFYRLGKELFGFWPAFWATLIYMFASSNPLLSFADGNYPDMLNYGVFIPLFFLFTLRALKQNVRKNAAVAMLFLSLMIMTHHLTTIFSLLIMIFYLLAIFLYRRYGQTDDAQFKNYKKVVFCFALFSIVAYILIRATFGPMLSQAINSVLSLNSPQNLRDFSEPLPYSDIPYSLTPLIEFIGATGLLLAILSIREKTAEKLLLIVWSLTLWFLSRTDLSGLAARYLREISVPLAILAGYSVNYFTAETKEKWQKFAFAGFFGFLIYTNAVQINIPPFLISEGGFNRMVWFTENDKEKVEYFKKNIPSGVTVVTNPSNPYLPYYLERDRKDVNYTVVRSVPEFLKNSTQSEMSEAVESFLYGIGSNYLFIGEPPHPGLDEKSYTQFAGFARTTNFFNQYDYFQSNLVKRFSDGSRLILIKR